MGRVPYRTRKTMRSVTTELHLDVISTVGCMGGFEGTPNQTSLVEALHGGHAALSHVFSSLYYCLFLSEFGNVSLHSHLFFIYPRILVFF